MSGQDAQRPQGYGTDHTAWDWSSTNPTVQVGWSAPPTPPPPRRPRVWPLVALASVLALGMVAAAVTVGRPLLERVLPTVPGLPGLQVPSAPVSAAQASDYTHGARRAWMLDLKRQFPDAADPRFSFGPDLDDASSMFRFGVVDANTVYLAQVHLGGQSGALIGLDPATGAVLWTDREVYASGCVIGGKPGQAACVLDKAGTTVFALLDATTGVLSAERPLSRFSYLVGNADAIVVGTPVGNDGQLQVLGLDWSGQQRWQATLTDAEQFQDVSESMFMSGDVALVATNNGWTAYAAVSGKELAANDGWLSVLPDGRIAADGSNLVTHDQSVEIVHGHFTGLGEKSAWGLFREQSGVAWCADHSPSSCRDLGLGQLARLSGQVSAGGRTYAVVSGADRGRVTFVDVMTGRLTGSTATPSETFSSAPGLGGVLVVGQTGGRVSLVNPANAATLASATMPNWQPAPTMPGKIMLMHTRPGDNVAAMADAIAVYEPADAADGWVAPEANAAATTAAQAAPNGIPECPSGSVRLAYATFVDGWVLVCGVNARTPLSWAWSVGGVQQSSASVRLDDATGRYIATLEGGAAAWISPAPAMVGRADAGGQLTLERSVGQIWFVELGSALPTTGASGVPVPQQTDADQIRYLSEIIAKSTAARAALVPAVNALAGCTHGASAGGYGAEVATIDGVAQNRAELLGALQSAPVDKVPDGIKLVNQLRAGLQLSFQADQAFGSWARAINTGGCPSGSSAQGESLSEQAGVQKTAFAQTWNTTIAPRYGVPTVSRETL